MTIVQESVGAVRIECESRDEPTARLVAQACQEAVALAKDRWGLGPPSDCRVYVMTSWRDFVFRSAPWPWKILLALTYPLWSSRVKRAWPISAGWTQHYGRRVAIGIKPPRLLETSDKSVGVHMYVEEKDPVAKIRHLTCHELIHAASAHLRLPPWLNEGLAAVSVDHFMGKATIRPESLDLVRRVQPKATPPSYRAMARFQGELLAYHAVRGYWIVRFLEDLHPGFLRSLLGERRAPAALERQIAERLGLKPADLWRDIDQHVAEHLRSRDRAIG